jgi:hypothetical protein
MPDTILSGDFTVYYGVENRQKRIVWTGSAAGTRTVNELYSALQDLFDELTQLDDGTPMSAQTPTEYTIGSIDTGAADPWFIDRVTVEHLTGGALRTASWSRAASNTGIVLIEYTTGTDFIESDIGKTVTNGTSNSSGTLLDFNSTGTTNVAWIRPLSADAQHNWGGTTGTVTVTGGTGSVTQSAAAVTGESLWANIFTLGTIESNTHMLIEQESNTRLVRYKSTDNTDWWEDGHIDILINVSEVGVDVDEGRIIVFARQQSKTYSFFATGLANGGRNPIPLQTGNDLDNQYGYRELTTKAPVTGDAFDVDDVGKVIFKQGEITLRAVITSISGTSPTQTIQYYYIGDPVHTDATAREFANNDIIETEGASPKTATVDGSTTAVNAPTYSGNITVSFPSAFNDFVFDVDENDTDERYSIQIDLQNVTSLDQMQQYLKYITRRGATDQLNNQDGQFYIGSEFRIRHSSTATNIPIGAEVTQSGTSAIGTVVAHHTTTTPKILILKSTRGSFNTTDDITDGTNTIAGADISVAAAITPNAASPFGTFAGGTFFGAAGVLLINVPGDDATNFQLVNDAGAVVRPPNKVGVRVGNTRAEDRVAVFRLLGGVIDKEEYAAAAASAAATTIGVSNPATIAVDVPGKVNGGALRIVDISEQTEYRLRYSDWSGADFTLASTSGTATGGNQTTLTDSGANFTATAVVGDLVYNSTELTYAYVVSVDSGTQLTTTNLNSSAPVTDWNGDGYSINALPTAITTNDFIYIPLLDRYEDTGTDASPGSEESTLTFDQNIAVRVIARNANETDSNTTPMLPYSADATVTNIGLNNNIIRSKDNIKETGA